MVFAGKHFELQLGCSQEARLIDGCFCETKENSLPYIYGSIEFRQNNFVNCSLKLFKGSFFRNKTNHLVGIWCYFTLEKYH